MTPVRNTRLATTVSAVALAVAAGGLAAVPAPVLAGEAAAVSIFGASDDLPGPIECREPWTVTVELEAIELMGELDAGTTFRYWTFDGTVPGPMLRVRVGDTVEVTTRNRGDSGMLHNVGLHAVTGPRGGGHATVTEPDVTTGFTLKALKPSRYVYQCTTPTVAQQIANGMCGLIIVEPEEDLPPVDREFYVMQGDICTAERFGTRCELTENYKKLLDERLEYHVFNGAVHGLKTEVPLRAEVGETVRILFGVGGPNKSSSCDVIGEIFDRVHDLGSATGGVTSDVQTVSVAPGGATIVEMTPEVPGQYVLVDHAMSRAKRGLAAVLEVERPEVPKILREGFTERASRNE